MEPQPEPTRAVNPSQRSVDALAARPDDDAIIMVNLLQYAPDDGRAAYARYGAVAGGTVRARGGAPVFAGTVIDDASPWDTALLVRYPRRSAYLDMQNDPAYVGVIPERTRGLSARLLYPFHPAAGDPDDRFGIERSGGDEVFVVDLLRFDSAPEPEPGPSPAEGDVVLRLQADVPMVSDDRWDELVVTRYPSAIAALDHDLGTSPGVEGSISLLTRPS